MDYPYNMSNLHRSAISARLSKLQSYMPSHYPGMDFDEDNEEEEGDDIGDLPGSGLGPPAMQVTIPLNIL